MKLMPKELERRFAEVSHQEGKSAIVIAKFFDPCSQWTWFATEFDPETQTFFGLVRGFEVEGGYFSLDELESAKGPLGIGIERDLYWTERPAREVEEMLKAG